MFNKFFNWLLDLRAAWNVQTVRNDPVLLNRLTDAQYEAFEKKAHAVTIVNSTTTELQAGYQLGVQHALKVLREGWAV